MRTNSRRRSPICAHGCRGAAGTRFLRSPTSSSSRRCSVDRPDATSFAKAMTCTSIRRRVNSGSSTGTRSIRWSTSATAMDSSACGRGSTLIPRCAGATNRPGCPARRLRDDAALDVPIAGGRGPALFALHVAVALFGFAALFGKWVALSPVAIVLGRTVVAAATLALVSSMRRQAFGQPERGLLLNGPLLALHWVSFFAAVQVSSVAIALLGYASFPVVVLLLERGRRASFGEYATALLAALGLAMLAAHLSWSSAGLRGLALALVSAVTFAMLVVRNRRLVVERSAARIAMWQNLAAAACLLPI